MKGDFSWHLLKAACILLCAFLNISPIIAVSLVLVSHSFIFWKLTIVMYYNIMWYYSVQPRVDEVRGFLWSGWVLNGDIVFDVVKSGHRLVCIFLIFVPMEISSMENKFVTVNWYRNCLTWSLLGSADSTTEICCNCTVERVCNTSLPIISTKFRAV